jgi:hypothetical protein
MLVFKHPKFYAELRKKRKQYLKELEASHVKKAISPKQSTDRGGRAPKHQATEASSLKPERQALSIKPKPQANEELEGLKRYVKNTKNPI